MRKLPKELTTVTKVSKTVALIMFILLPIIGFLYGMKYQEMQDTVDQQIAENTMHLQRGPTPTPDTKIANAFQANASKMYTNLLGFSFMYPAAWKLQRTANNLYDMLQSPDFAFAKNPSTEQLASSGELILIPHGSQHSGVKSFSQVQNGIMATTDENSPKIITNRKDVLLDGQKAQEYDYRSQTHPEIMGTIVEVRLKDNDVYSLQMIYASPSYKTTLEKILSTFKFTN